MEIVSRSAARVAKGGRHADRDKGMSDPQSHSNGRTLALASNVMASNVPHKRVLLHWRDGWRVHHQLQVSQDFLHDADLGDFRDDPQPALLTHRAAFHVQRPRRVSQIWPADRGSVSSKGYCAVSG